MTRPQLCFQSEKNGRFRLLRASCPGVVGRYDHLAASAELLFRQADKANDVVSYIPSCRSIIGLPRNTVVSPPVGTDGKGQRINYLDQATLDRGLELPEVGGMPH